MLVLEIDASDDPEGRVGFRVKFESTMEMRGVEEGVESITTVAV